MFLEKSLFLSGIVALSCSTNFGQSLEVLLQTLQDACSYLK